MTMTLGGAVYESSADCALCRRVKLDVEGHPFLPLPAHGKEGKETHKSVHRQNSPRIPQVPAPSMPHHGGLFVGESGREQDRLGRKRMGSIQIKYIVWSCLV